MWNGQILAERAASGWQSHFEHERVAMSQERSSNALLFSGLALFAALQLLQLSRVDAYKALIPLDPANPGKCIYRGDVLAPGINNGIPPCQRLTCNADGSIQIEGCGKLRIEKCNQGERIHQSKPFPECCLLRYKCKEANGAPYYIERDAAVGA